MDCNEEEKKCLLDDLAQLTRVELESIRYIVRQLAEDHRQEEMQDAERSDQIKVDA